MPRALALLLALLLLSACSPTPPPTPPAPPVSAQAVPPLLPPEALPAGVRLTQPVRPERYELELEISPKKERFQGTVAVDVALAAAVRSVFLHARGLDLSAAVAKVGGQTITLAVTRETESVVRLSAPRSLPAGKATLEVLFSGPFGHLQGLYTVGRGGERYAFTQLEPIHAREAFPCFDEPEHKTPFDLSLVVPEGDRALANTPERSREATADGRVRVRFQRTKPLPTYLVAFATGPLDVVEAAPIPPNAARKEPLPLRGVATKGRGPELRRALERTGAVLQALELWFGLPYPYEKLDLVAVPEKRGAMENPGLVTFREWLLLLGPDASQRQQRYFFLVTAHELAHQWFGNLVTMRWWDDLWLKEGFATFLAAEIARRACPECRADAFAARSAEDAMAADGLASARRVRQPIDAEGDIHNAYDAITYQKGSALLGSLQRWYGTKLFQERVRGFLEAHAHGTATADELFAALREPVGPDPVVGIASLTEQAGLPLVRVESSCKDGQADVSLRVSRFAPVGAAMPPATWRVPVCLRVPATRATAGYERCVLVSSEAGAVEKVHLPTCPAPLVPNAGGAGYYRFSVADDAWQALLRAPALDLRERLAVIGSLGAAVRAGTVALPRALTLLEPLVKEAEPALALAAAELLRLALRLAEGTPAQAAVEKAGRRLYGPRAKSATWAADPRETLEAAQIRHEVLSFLATAARDPAVRKAAAAQGKAFTASLAGASDKPTALDPNLVGTALAVHAEDGGAPAFVDLLRALDRTKDEAHRSHLVFALASAHGPDVVDRSRALALDARLQAPEVPVVLDAHLRDPRTRDAAFTWLDATWEPIVARLPPASVAGLPRLVESHCSRTSIERLDATIGARLDGVRAAARTLEQSREAIRLCAALAEKLGPDLASLARR